MVFLYETQHYIDRYDLRTIEHCLMILNVKKIILKHEPIKKWYTFEDHKAEVDKVIAIMLNTIMADAYTKKEKTIADWIVDDTEVQNRYDLAQTPNIKCEQCHKKMEEMYRTFKGSDHKASPLEFILACKDCRKIIHIDENGIISIPEPIRCEKCKAVVHIDVNDIEKHVWENTYICASCGHKFHERIDHREFNKKLAEDKKRDTLLLEQYRSRFCLEGEAGESLAKAVGNFYLAQDIYKYEYSKHATPEQDKIHEIDRLDIKGLTQLLTKTLQKVGYSQLKLGHPNIDRYVDVPFTVQLPESEEDKSLSVHKLDSTLKPALENTNWRLMKDSTRYRLGYLAGTLRGYEQEDDLLKLFEKKVPKQEEIKPPDPERMAKFDGYIGWAGLARISAEYDANEKRRQARLKSSPEGYCLPESDSSTHQCTVCYASMKITERWYCDYGILCNDCHRNLTGSCIDSKAIREHEYFGEYNIKSAFKVHRQAEIRKVIEDNNLIHHDFTNAEGKIYFTLFLKEENWKFVRDNPIGHDHPPMVVSDGKGGTNKL